MEDLRALVDWLEYGRFSGYIAARQSKVQEESWAEQLRKLLDITERYTTKLEEKNESPVRDV